MEAAASQMTMMRIRKIRIIPPPEDPGDTVPLGDGMWALMLLACAYLIVRVTRKRALKR